MYPVHPTIILPKRRPSIHRDKENPSAHPKNNPPQAPKISREPFLVLPTNHVRSKSTSVLDTELPAQAKKIKKPEHPTAVYQKRARAAKPEDDEVFVDAKEYLDLQATRLLPSSDLAVGDGLKRKPAVKRTLSHRSNPKGELNYKCSLFAEEVYHSPYLMETVKYFLTCEWKHVLRESRLLKEPAAIKDRKSVLHWLQKLQMYVPVSPTVLLSTARLFDYVLATGKISAGLYQLVVMVVFWLVQKADNSATIKARKMLNFCNNVYPREVFLDMEKKVLKFLDFDVVLPDPITFVCYYLKGLQMDQHFKILSSCAAFILESFMLHPNYSMVPPSLQAAAATYLAVRTLLPERRSHWVQLAAHSGYYPAAELQSLRLVMAQVVREQRDPKCTCRDAYLKYSRAEFGSVSLLLTDKME